MAGILQSHRRRYACPPFHSVGMRTGVFKAISFSTASVYSGYEVDDDWCVTVLQSYQPDREVLFPWSVGKPLGPLHIYKANRLHTYMCLPVHAGLASHTVLCLFPGEDMDSDGRRQLALFLVRSLVIHALKLCVCSFLSGLGGMGHLLSLSRCSEPEYRV